MLRDLIKSGIYGRAAVFCVGEEGRGDDGVGPMVAGLLSKADVGNVIDGGASPESDTWRVREIAPETVLFVDAVDFGGSAGDAAVLRPKDLRIEGFDTHRAPLRLTMEYLEGEHGCRCVLLAVQPRDVRIGSAMSEEVRATAGEVAAALTEIMNENVLE